MPHSVRISDELWDNLQDSARTMRRSIGQQLEFLARLGMAVESSPEISAQQLQELARGSFTAAGDAPADAEFDAAFDALARMQGNPALHKQLAATGHALPGRDEAGHLVMVQPRDNISRTGTE